jgi:hypothetical protein
VGVFVAVGFGFFVAVTSGVGVGDIFVLLAVAAGLDGAAEGEAVGGCPVSFGTVFVANGRLVAKGFVLVADGKASFTIGAVVEGLGLQAVANSANENKNAAIMVVRVPIGCKLYPSCSKWTNRKL